LPTSSIVAAIFRPIPVEMPDGVCEVCGGPMGTHPLKQFCSGRCRNRARRERIKAEVVAR
jgi:hypothetical protein